MRTEKSLLNISTAIVGQIFGILITFFSRLVFIRVLGAEYLGVNGLFSNILSMLSLVEMGVGPAIIFSLYKPLAFNDENKVKGLMNFYAKAYRIIGCLVFFIGLGILPFMDVFIKNQPDIPHLDLIYMMFLVNSAISYFFAYKRSLIIADQKNYIATIYRYTFFFLLNILQIVILLVTRNFLLFLAAQILMTFLENLLVSMKADKLYPYISGRNDSKLDQDTRDTIFMNVKALILHKVGGTVVFSTTNIIISAFLGVVWVGLYSNYVLVTSSVNIIIGQFYTAITSSVGNLNAYDDRERSVFIFKTLFFVTWWIHHFSSICLLILINPFIILWLGTEYAVSYTVVLILIINFFVTGMRKATLTFKDSMGLFWYDRYKPVAESIINLVVALILVNRLGIIGIFLANFISTMTTCFWVEPFVLYKYGFRSSSREYFRLYVLYTLITIGTAFLAVFISDAIFPHLTMGSFMGRLFLGLVLPNLLVLGFYKTEEFKYLLNVGKGLGHKLLDVKNIASWVNDTK